jgi:[ribosomal protein S5]-alanine N-acetyltransferase
MLQFNFKPFPVLSSNQLVFRQLNYNDIQKIIELRGNKAVMQYIPRPLITEPEQAIALIDMMNEKINENKDINWAITTKDNDELIGIIGFYRTEHENYRSEIGYMFLPEYHGKGIATEAVKHIIHYGFTFLQLHSICAIIDARNIGSEKVLLKAGFRQEGYFKQNCFYNNEFSDSINFGLLKSEYLANTSNTIN